MSDPGSTYRSRDEINAMRTERDPIERVKKLLLANGKEHSVPYYARRLLIVYYTKCETRSAGSL
jgi:hypothetical protein